MRLFALIVSLFFAVGVSSAMSAGKAGTCVVTPDPVSLSQTPSWTVTANGGDPTVDYYEIQLRENGVPRQDEGTTIARVPADANGVVTYTFETMDYRTFPYSNFWPTLVPGTAKIAIKSVHQGGGTSTTGQKSTLAACQFSVVE